MAAILYVHSPVLCDVCYEEGYWNLAEHHCGHEDCRTRMFICRSCKPGHNTYNKHRGAFLKSVIVSAVESKCCKDGHSDRSAPHVCYPCRLPVCDECRDDHVKRGHSFTEIQSEVVAQKTELTGCLNQLKDSMKQLTNLTSLADPANTHVKSKFTELRNEVEANTKKLMQKVKEHGEALQRELVEREQQLHNDLKSATQPLDDKESVVIEGQQFLDCKDVEEIFRNYGPLLEKIKAECLRMNDRRLSISALMSTFWRMKVIPNVAIHLDQVICTLKQVCSLPLSDAAVCCFLAAHPDGGFVMGSVHKANQSATSVADLVVSEDATSPADLVVSEDATSAADLVVSEEQTPISTKLSFYSVDGQVTKVREIRKLPGNDIVRGIAVLPHGGIAVLGQHIQIYVYRNDDFELNNVIPPKDGSDWCSIAVDHSGLLLAGDCRNDCIDVFSANGHFRHSIPCNGVMPRQCQAIASGRIIIAQPGEQDLKPMIQVLNPNGSVFSSISDEAWDYAFCSADDLENLYIASVRLATVGRLLTLARYTLQGNLEEVIMKDKIVKQQDFSLAVQGGRIMLSSFEHSWIFA